VIDDSEVFDCAMSDFGTPVILAGQTIRGLYDPPAASGSPYLDDPGETPDQVTVRRSDLETIGQWPLTATELTCNGRTWSIIRPDAKGGAITIILRQQ
jgi:hypothetical protein